ncbi:MAG: hypothetical protein HXS46_00405 [Theionarchaea archaeon]|nr:hypothetical protein [Theionarchaea archaeon]
MVDQIWAGGKKWSTQELEQLKESQSPISMKHILVVIIIFGILIGIVAYLRDNHTDPPATTPPTTPPATPSPTPTDDIGIGSYPHSLLFSSMI